MSAQHQLPPPVAPNGSLLPREVGINKRTHEASQGISSSLSSSGLIGLQRDDASSWGAPPRKQGRMHAGAIPFPSLTAAVNRVHPKLLPSHIGNQTIVGSSNTCGKGRAVLAIKAGNEGVSSACNGIISPSSPSLMPSSLGHAMKGSSHSRLKMKDEEDEKESMKHIVLDKKREQLVDENVVEEPWRVSQRCHLFAVDLSCAYTQDEGQDNQHNCRTAQSGYSQEAYRADKAHPGEYLKGFKRLTAEARDLIVCILNKVAMQLSQQGGGGWHAQWKPPDSLDPRVAAVVGVAVQLFDRTMAVIHKADIAYGLHADKKQHPLRGLTGRGGTHPLLLNQLIGIACFGFADRLEAISSADYATIVEVWRQNTAGMLRSAWPLSLTFNDALRNKLLLIERIIIVFIAPSGNVAVAPISELTESLLNAGYLHATARYRNALREKNNISANKKTIAQQRELLQLQLQQKEQQMLQKEQQMLQKEQQLQQEEQQQKGEEQQEKDAPSSSGFVEQQQQQKQQQGQKQQQHGSKSMSTSDLSAGVEEEEKIDYVHANPFVDALVYRGVSPSIAESCGLSLRISGSSRVDITRQVAQVYVRLALLDRNICLQFKPSTIAAAAAQLAMFPCGGAAAAAAFPAELHAALGAAAAAVAATGGSASFRLVRRCQLLLLHKWIAVKRILLQRGVATPSSPPSSSSSPSSITSLAEYLPDRLIADWIRRGLVLPHHRRVLIAVQQHASTLLRCQLLGKQQESLIHKQSAVAAAANVNVDKEKGRMGGGGVGGVVSVKAEKNITSGCMHEERKDTR